MTSVIGESGRGKPSAAPTPLRAKRVARDAKKPVPRTRIDSVPIQEPADVDRDADRRTWTPAGDRMLVACVDVEPSDVSARAGLRSSAMWDLAVRRVERCVRPGDWMCMLGGTRMAVCLGSGSDRVSPSALGERLVRAMGDHLTVGSSGLDLHVTIGISAGDKDVGLSRLTSAALSALSAGRGQGELSPSVLITQLPARPLRVVHGDDSAGCRAETNGNGSRALKGRIVPRLAKRSMLPRKLTGVAEVEGELGVAASQSAVMRVLVIGAMPPSNGSPRFGVEATAAVIRAAGARVTVAPSNETDKVLLDAYVTDPHVVVVVLEQHDTRRRVAPTEGHPWEREARLVRALRATETPVVAVSLGASAAALAACVEQGAIGLLDATHLPEELAAATGTPTGSARRSADNGEGTRPLPASYAGLIELTPTERRVLFQMMEGRAAVEIAERLVVSLPTVRSHIRSILRKLNVKSQLAAVAIANGVLPDHLLGA